MDVEGTPDLRVLAVAHTLLNETVRLQQVLLLVAGKLQLHIDSADLLRVAEVVALEVQVLHVAVDVHLIEGLDHLVDVARRQHQHRTAQTEHRAQVLVDREEAVRVGERQRVLSLVEPGEGLAGEGGPAQVDVDLLERERPEVLVEVVLGHGVPGVRVVVREVLVLVEAQRKLVDVVELSEKRTSSRKIWNWLAGLLPSSKSSKNSIWCFCNSLL